MKRTYNFQVDAGIFVAEYYLKKEYTDITEQDLRENIDMLTHKLHEYNNLGTLGYMSHQNTALTQGKGVAREGRIKAQLTLLLDSVGEDKACMICGEKRVNTRVELPYSSLMYGLASHNTFMNRGNNLRTVDVCPICLFFSLIGFLNTQKISYPYVCISDSDEFMREYTEETQKKVSRKTMLDIKMKDMPEHIIPELTKLMQKKERGNYEGLNYITLVQYANAKTNNYIESVIPKKSLDFLSKIKYRGLMPEFYKLGLFWQIKNNQNMYNHLASRGTKCSLEIYEMIKGESMKKQDIKIIEQIATKLVEQKGKEQVLKELKLVNSQQAMRAFLIDNTKEVDLGLTIQELDNVIKKYNSFRDYITIEIQIKQTNKEEN